MACASLMKALRGEGKQTVFGASVSMIAELSRMAGVPAANLKREIMSFALTAAIETDSYLMEYHLRKVFYKVSENTAMYYDILYSAMQSDQEAYEIIYADMVKNGLTEDKIRNGMETRMKKSQGVSSVEDPEQRFLSPNQEQSYTRYHTRLESSSLWKKASAEQRSAVEDDLYQLIASTSDGIKMQEKLEDGARYGIDEADYLLYELAKEVANGDGNGSTSQAEAEAAIDMLTGLSDQAKAYLWQSTNNGWSEKNNPYK